MSRAILLFLLLLSVSVTWAQDELTEGFARLSAKERARLARQEESEAALDTQFQQAMASAEESFRQKRYEEAMARYEQARAMRPLNVYPKVKIDDLRALIARRDSLAALNAVPEPVPIPDPQPQPAVGPEADAPPPVQPAPGPARMEEAPVPRPALRQEVPPVVRTPTPAPVVDRTPAPEPELIPDGMTERTLREGRAIVLERVKVVDGQRAVWRRVSHPWGEVVYFKDGLPISSGAWMRTFGD